MNHIFFIHSYVEGHLGSFHNLAIVHNAAVNAGGPSLHYACIFGVNTQHFNCWIVG